MLQEKTFTSLLTERQMMSFERLEILHARKQLKYRFDVKQFEQTLGTFQCSPVSPVSAYLHCGKHREERHDQTPRSSNILDASCWW